MQNKPPINIVSVVQSSSSAQSNNVQVTIADGAGLKRVLNLSPSAQDGFIKSLLGSSPIDSPSPVPKNFLVAKNTRLFQGQDGVIGLEVSLWNQIAVHILLPGLLAEGLQNQFQQFVGVSSNASSKH